MQGEQRLQDIDSVLLPPVAVTKDNIKDTVVADGFWTAEQITDLAGTQGGRRRSRTAVTAALKRDEHRRRRCSRSRA